MKKNISYIFYMLLLVIINSCKKPYLPPVVAAPNSYLVVEGVVNAGADSTFIKLSRTVNLANKVSLNPESGASLTVLSDGESYPLKEKEPGVYVSSGLNLNRTKKYNLKIATKDGEVYQSDAGEVHVTPPIDSVSYVVGTNDLSINVSAHDPNNSTKYYRWEYNEDWRFRAKYQSNYKVVGDTVLPRGLNEQIYSCFGKDASSTILIGSSAKLSADVIANQPITVISSGSEKLSVRYSMLLRQYALTNEEYQFWEQLKKNTEQLGSVFDALPSQSIGNIHNTAHPNIPVIGYVSVSTVQSKRIYINKDQLLGFFPTDPFGCEVSGAYYIDPKTGDNTVRIYLTSDKFLYTPIDIIGLQIPGKQPKGYTISTPDCTDCTTRGVTKQPAFWQDK